MIYSHNRMVLAAAIEKLYINSGVGRDSNLYFHVPWQIAPDLVPNRARRDLERQHNAASFVKHLVQGMG